MSVAARLGPGPTTLPAPRGWLALLRRRLAGRPDSEHEITLNRIVLNCAVGAYVVASSRMGDAGAQYVLGLTAGMFWFYCIMSAALFAHLLVYPGISHGRRLIGLLLDLGTICTFGVIGDGATAFVYPIYLWTIFGNGFRFGIPYLAIAAMFGSAGFGFVVISGSYWRANPNLAAGLMAGLVILPAYVGLLIQKLSVAKRQAEEANKAKSLFLASVSHELRTPLTAVIGYADLLRDTPLTREQGEMASSIGASGRSLLRLINSLLDISRSELGQMPVNVQRLDLHRLLAEVHGMLQMEAKAKDLDLALHIGARTPRFIRASERHLHEVLVNLCSNAVKFTKQGHVLLTSDLVAVRNGILRLRFEVEDSGIGIPPEAQGRIFEEFTQADDTIIDNFGGTGLGLAISRQLVKAQNGDIGVTSAKGAGSTFWFEVEALADLPQAETAASPIARGRPVLVLSGDPRLAAAVERLGGEAIGLHAPAKARAAIAAIAGRGSHRCVVLLDELMFGRDLEREAAELLQQCAKAAPLLVAVAAGARTDILSREGLRSLATCLPRPLSESALGNIIAFADGAARGDRQDAAPVRAVRILVAEDNRTNQKVIARMLEKAGHAVEMVGDGEAALDALEDGAFHIVLMDVNMPVLNGIEAAKLYRFAMPDGPRVPIVALTADASSASRERCIAAGMAACLTKPIDADQLIAAIEAIAAQEPLGMWQMPAAPAARSEGGACIDPSALADLEALGGEGFVREIVAQFSADAASVLKSLATAVNAADVEQFRDQAHALRSCAANVGAQRVYATCLAWREIEAADIARNGGVWLEQLEAELAQARAALASHLEQAADSAPRKPGRPALRLVSTAP